MAAEVDYLPVATADGANVTPQAQYAGSRNQTLGVQAGKAASADANKAWRQSSMMASAIAFFISNALGGADVIDDGNQPALTQLFLQAVQSVAQGQGLTLAQIDAATLTQQTPAVGDNSTNVATTAFITAALAAALPKVSLLTVVSGAMTYLVIRFAPNGGNAIELALGTGYLGDNTAVPLPNNQFSYQNFLGFASAADVPNGGRTINNLHASIVNGNTTSVRGTDNTGGGSPATASVLAIAWRTNAS